MTVVRCSLCVVWLWFVGCLLIVCWLFVGCLLVVCCLFGCLLFVGCLLAVCCLFVNVCVVRVLRVCWLVADSCIMCVVCC